MNVTKKYLLIFIIIIFSITPIFSLVHYLGPVFQINGGVYFDPGSNLNHVNLSFGANHLLIINELISFDNILFFSYTAFNYSNSEKQYGFNFFYSGYFNLNMGNDSFNFFISPAGLKLGFNFGFPMIEGTFNKDIDVIFFPGYTIRVGLNVVLNKKFDIILTPAYFNFDFLPSAYINKGIFHLLILFGIGTALKFRMNW